MQASALRAEAAASALPPSSTAGAGAEETRKEGGREAGRRGGEGGGAGVSRGNGVEEQGTVLPKSGVTGARTFTSETSRRRQPQSALYTVHLPE